MRKVHRYLGSLLLAAAVIAPTLVVSTAQAQEVNVRVYDRDHHDYHNWDDHENLAYRRYLEENHREYREYNRQNHRDQRAYWNWRHGHPD
jgi:type III secretory pathway component EscR